jgi:16S rRNA (uracil1498-N3)-methyltransferase
MSDRFFSSQPISGDRATLGGSEAHHLLHVMRAVVGTSVTLFDGSGAEFDAVVESVRRAEATLRIVERREVDRELPAPLIIGVSLPKGDRQKWLVEKLTELGVTELAPLITERGVAQPTDSAIERLSRSAIEAAKQCGRNRLMRIAAPQNWSAWITNEWLGSSRPSPGDGALERPAAWRRLIAHPNGKPISETDLCSSLPTQLAIGPEGGLTETEVAAAIAAGWQSVSLGPRVLRVETAAIGLAATISLLNGHLRHPAHSNDARTLPPDDLPSTKPRAVN